MSRVYDNNIKVDASGNATITGDLTVNGTTTTISTTNSVVSDKLIELGNGTSGTPSGDAGIVVERGSSTNAAIVWDESEDRWVAATTSATGASTGDLTITPTDFNVSDLVFTPDGITTSHITTAGSLKIRATNNMHIGDDGVDSIRLGRTNSTAAKIHLRSGTDADLVVANSKVGIGVDDPDTALEVFNTSTQQKWSYDADSFATLTVADDSHTTIANGQTGDLILDAGDDIHLDAGGNTWKLLVAGSLKSYFEHDNSGDITLHNETQDKDLKFSGNDGGSGVVALRLDMADAGSATFNSSISMKEKASADADVAAYGQLWVKTGTPNELYFTTDAGDDIQITSGTAMAFVGDITGVTAGDGLSGGGNSGAVSLALDLNELSATTVAVASDSIAIIDADDNGSKKESIADLVTAIAGTAASTGLSASSGVLSVSDLHPVGVDGAANQLLTDDGDGTVTSEAGLTFDSGLLTVSGNTDGAHTALVLKNEDDTADSNGSVILRFDLEDTSGNAVDSGSIRVKKLNSFTNTSSTQDSKMDFYVSEDGTITRQGAFVGGSEFSFGNRNSTINIDASSGTNTAGKTLTIRGGAGTGSGAGGSIVFKTADGGGSGSSVNSHATALTLADDLSATFAGDVTVSGGDIAYGNGQDATLTVDAVSGTDTAGKDLTIKAGVGTGAGDPGDIHFQVAVPGGSGSSAQSTVPTMSMSPEGVSTFWGGTAALGNDTGVGDIVTFGTEDSSDTLAAGRLMYLHTDGKWKYCDADAVATGGTQLLGIALGTAVTDGLLIRGFFKLNSYTEGTWNEGLPCYVSEATGEIDFTAPSASGDFVRVVGYGTDTSGVIFFNPSATNIVIA